MDSDPLESQKITRTRTILLGASNFHVIGVEDGSPPKLQKCYLNGRREKEMECCVHEAHQTKAESLSRRFLRSTHFNQQAQLMLYDESQRLLECRMLRRDEVVCSAQTLTFAAYFVDVGLLHSPSPLKSDARRNSNEARPINLRLSPSQKIIREFKKIEMQKYGASQTAPTIMQTSVTEWQVMYTTQVTQKAKKYHDGFLQLKISGTLQRQIMLYDGSKKLIDSRFLKKDEVIQSGESIAFDAHLVNIGEAEGNCQGVMDSDVRLSNCNVAGKTRMIHRVQNCLKTNKSFLQGKPQKIASSKIDAEPSFSISSVGESKLNQNISANKPLRDGLDSLAKSSSSGNKSSKNTEVGNSHQV
ncbi:uncharacterized protein LOC111315806 isoform X5 [Durio zibethinus]|uniref:Uncharacterized protein LOC111315806 isoform X5 n=1 Tax=Durio zibethinus TaxID=66656 RepID=A0A6P6B9S9_DURZI|nr:uncharacterized protein LOC111315806 isoform X5 [Durio zibethinus]